MKRKLEGLLRYTILLIIFIVLIRSKTLNRLSYSIFLIFIILSQSIKYVSKKESRLIILILLEFLSLIYLSNISFDIFILLSFLILLDIINYLKLKNIVILNIVYLMIVGYFLYLNFSIQHLMSLILSYFMALNLGYLNREYLNINKLENKINKLQSEQTLRNLENEKKDIILKDIYITKERNRISRDIHDSVGHSLSTIIIQLSAIEQIAKIDGDKASDLSSNLRIYAIDAMNDIRNVLKDTKPKDSLENELIIMIENLIEENMKLTNIDIVFKFSANRYLLDYRLEKLIYNAIKEFISNSIKHGQASKININLFYKETELVLSMKDNGLGTDNIIRGMGLKSLAERVRENNGELHVQSAKNDGFFISINIAR